MVLSEHRLFIDLFDGLFAGLAEWELDADENMGVVLSCDGDVPAPDTGSCETGYQCTNGNTFEECCPDGCTAECGCPLCES